MNLRLMLLKLRSYFTDKPISIGTGNTVETPIDVVIPLSRLSVKYELVSNKYIYLGNKRAKDGSTLHTLLDMHTATELDVPEHIFKQLFRKIHQNANSN